MHLLQNSQAISNVPLFDVCHFLYLLGTCSSKVRGVSNLTPVVPSVQHFFSGVVIHHRVEGIQVCEGYAGDPLFSCLGVVSKVDGGGLAVIGVDTVDHSTDHKSIAHRAHWFCTKAKKICTHASSVGRNHSLCYMEQW